ncbi:UNVERIFIED_ORG: acetyl esterase/lipase [Gordonia westfalica J30]
MTPPTHPIDVELESAAAALPRIDRADTVRARQILSERFDGTVTDPEVATTDHAVPVRDGRQIAVRVYTPRHRTSRSAVYHVHGGGFILGDLEMSHARNVAIARDVGCIVVSVDYRLAPEWPYPTPLHDVHDGLVWLHDHAATLDVDPSRIVLHGVSAGAGLVAAVSLLARDQGGPPIPFQYMASPIVDDRMLTHSSLAFTDTPALTRLDVQTCWAAYLGDLDRGGPAVPVYAAPARATDHSGLPRTYITVAEFDPLRDEAIDYGRALLRAGVSTGLHLFPGTFHGSSAVDSATVSARERAQEIDVLTQETTRTREPATDLAIPHEEPIR